MQNMYPTRIRVIVDASIVDLYAIWIGMSKAREVLVWVKA
jgi:hypothetical protein